MFSTQSLVEVCGHTAKMISLEKMSVDFQNEADLDLDLLARSKCDEVYEFQEIIGEGTFSAVVRATHNISKAKRAIKVIDMEKMRSGNRQWRVRNEIDLHQRCRHAHVVHLYEAYETELDACLVMEFCAGGELFERIVRRGYLSETQAARTMRQIGSAVSAMHAAGIVHRDIKPENLLYTSTREDADIKLADFGMAKSLNVQCDDANFAASGREFLLASASGTTAYCAPERLNQSHESKAVDMWSVGCIVYFVLFGAPPFYSEKDDEEEADDEIIERIMKGQVDFPEHRPISDLAKDVITRLLDHEPARRMTADEFLQHPWLSMAICSASDVCEHWSPIRSRTILRSSINWVIDHETR